MALPNRKDPDQENRDLLGQIAARALELLKEEPPARQAAAEAWAEGKLREGNLLAFDPARKSPARWTAQAIAQNLDLIDQSFPFLRERDIHPEKAETFEELILDLIPREGGL